MRAKIVKDIEALKNFRWCGHGILIGKVDAGNLKSASKERRVTEAHRVVSYIGVCKLGYKGTDAPIIPTVYQLAIDRLGVKAAEIVFMSANAWDASGATTFGLRVAWINRIGQRPERLPFQLDIEI